MLFVDEEAVLHLTIGYAVATLVALRLVWGLLGPRYARFASFPPSPFAALGQLGDIATGRRQVHLGHSPLGGLMISNLLATMLVLGLTGRMMTTDAFWGVAWVEEAHEVAVMWAEMSIPVQVAALMWESLRTGLNLPRAMITGVKPVPAEARLAS